MTVSKFLAYWSETIAVIVLLGVMLVLVEGCSWAAKNPPDPTTERAELSSGVLSRPEAQDHREVQWQVFSAQERAAALRALNQERALMCVTAQNYENLSHNMSEITRWSRQMIELVRQYESRTRPEEDEDTEQ